MTNDEIPDLYERELTEKRIERRKRLLTGLKPSS